MLGVAANAICATIAAPLTVLLQPFGMPSVMKTTAAPRPGVIIVYCRAYWMAPLRAGTVGVLLPGMSAPMAAVIAFALPGKGAIATVGIAYAATLQALLPGSEK